MANDPVLIAYGPIKGRNGKTYWRRVGAAWPHDTGAGLTLQLDLVPLDGRVVLLEPDARDDAHILKVAAAKAKEFPSKIS